jgi:cyclophilin family peptidyl-prolyl cis-trans isomerase
MLNRILAIGLVSLLTACGGGGSDFSPIVTQIRAKSLGYGQTAVIYVAGLYMRNDMIADTGTCTNPSFSSASTPGAAILNCKVTAVGPLPITIKSANGAVLFSQTLTVLSPRVTMVTSKGNVVMELNPQAAPITVNNFLSYVNSGYYTSTLFHRVIAGFVVQGGGYTTGLVKKAGQVAPIALESNKGLLNTRSTVAMARTSVPDSATSEFFVNLVDSPTLDYQSATNPGYAVFGKVVQGMDVVDAIAAVPTATVGIFADVPTADVTISLAVQTQ